MNPPCRSPADQGVVLVGASVRSAAQSAAQAGFSVTAVDLFGDRDTRQASRQAWLIDDPRTIDQIRRGCSDAVIIPVGGLPGHAPFLDQLACHFPPFGRFLQWQRQLAEHHLLAEVVASAGLRFPPSQDAQHGLHGGPDPTRIRWLAKKVDRSGGFGVRWLLPHESGAEHEMVQQWIGGKNYGATLISDGRRAVVLGICRSSFTRRLALPFVYVGSSGPVSIAPQLHQSLTRLGHVLVKRTGVRGLINVDLIVDRDGEPWVLEVNPRWSGSSELIERHLGDAGLIGGSKTLFSWMHAALDGQLAEEASQAASAPTIDAGRWYCKRVLYAPFELRFDAIKLGAALQVDVSLHDIPDDGHRVLRGNPVCTVLVRSTSRATAAEKLWVTWRQLTRSMARCRVS